MDGGEGGVSQGRGKREGGGDIWDRRRDRAGVCEWVCGQRGKGRGTGRKGWERGR